MSGREAALVKLLRRPRSGRRRSRPATPTSITCESARLSAIRAATSTKTPIASQRTGANGTSGPSRSRGQSPATSIRMRKYPSTGYVRATEAVISARLKKKSEIDRPSRTSRSRCTRRSGRRGSKNGRREQQAEGEPDVGGVDLLGDRALIAAGERRPDLLAAKRLLDRAAAPVEEHDRDQVAVGSDIADLPGVAADQRPRSGIARLGELVGDDVGRAGGIDRVVRGQREAVGRTCLRVRLDERGRLLAAERRLERRILGGARSGRQRARTDDDGEGREQRGELRAAARHRRRARLQRPHGQAPAASFAGRAGR